MKKNILIGLLTVTTLLSLMYGFVQRAEADKQASIANAQRLIAEKAMADADQNRRIAEEQVALARLELEQIKSQGTKDK